MFSILQTEKTQKFFDVVKCSTEVIMNQIKNKFNSHIYFELPYIICDEPKMQYLTIYLKSFNECNKCPIHYYKKNNKNTSINNNIWNTFLELSSLPYFPKLYSTEDYEKLFDEKKNNEMFYMGKFVYSFVVEFKETIINEEQQVASCKISLIASEMEIKHNMSKKESILLQDVMTINCDTINNITIQI
jgi:hypothetical protein